MMREQQDRQHGMRGRRTAAAPVLGLVCALVAASPSAAGTSTQPRVASSRRSLAAERAESVATAVVVTAPRTVDQLLVCDVRPSEGVWSGRTLCAVCPEHCRNLLAEGDACVVRIVGAVDAAPCAVVLSPRRDRRLAVWVGVFLLAVVAAMGRRGVRVLVSLILAGVLIVGVLVPLTVRGWSPLGVAMALSVLICVAGILLVGGANRKSLHAVAGCLSALLLAAWLPVWLCVALRFTGLEVGFGTYFNVDIPLWYSAELARVDFLQVLLAGMILSGLGATMDVAITVSTAMDELRRSAPDLPRRARIGAGLAVGKDVLGMMAVTVLLIVVGSNVEMLLLVYHRGASGPAASLLNHEEIGAEVVRVVSCTLALGLAIPLTAVFAGWSRHGQPEPAAP